MLNWTTNESAASWLEAAEFPYEEMFQRREFRFLRPTLRIRFMLRFFPPSENACAGSQGNVVHIFLPEFF